MMVLVGCKSNDTAAPGNSGSTQSQSAADNAPFDSTCPTSNTVNFAKSKFVLHTGEGFGAFHRWLYNPYQQGTFGSGANGRTMAFVKGGLAALFIKRQVRLAIGDVKGSPILCNAIAAPLANIGNSVSSAVDRLKGGDAGGINAVNSSISSIENTSQADGDPIHEDDNANISGR